MPAAIHGDSIVLLTSSDSNSFPLLPLIRGEPLPTAWREDQQLNSSFAIFNFPNRLLVLKFAQEISELWRGLLCFHEGNHARLVTGVT